MTEAEFAQYGMTFGVGGLILWMFFIVFKLAQASKGGKYAYIALFLALGLGMFGFIAKTVIVEALHI